ncbi:MAG: hypothetical protein ACERKO_04965, partial [Acetanaerobacterium sp.]
MRRFHQQRSLIICCSLLLLAFTLGLAGCRGDEIPTTLPIQPSSSDNFSEPEQSSSSEPSSQEDSSVETSSTNVNSFAGSTGTTGNSGGSTVTTYSGKVYSSAVTSSRKETFNSVKITASGVSLSNKTITGNLIIDKGVGDGNVSLQNVAVSGTIYVYGGGEHSIYLDNVTAEKLISASTVSHPRIVAKGSTVIKKTEIRYDTLLEHSKLNATATGFTKIETVKTSQIGTILKLYNISLNTITLNYESKLFLLGSTSIASVIANKASYIEGGDKVGMLFCNNKNVTLDTAPGYISGDSGSYQPDIRDEYEDEDEDDTSSSKRTLSAPRITSSGSSIRWNAVSGARNGYMVRVNLTGSTVYLYETLSSGVRSLNVADLLADNNAPSGSYRVRLYARETSSRDASSYSNTISFTVTSGEPDLSLTDLAFDATDPSKYLLTWNAAGAAKGYNVIVATNTSLSNKKCNVNITDPSITSLDLRTAMGTSFVPDTYYVRITAKSAFEQNTAVGQFTVSRAATPTGLTYNDELKQLTWTAMSGVTQYKVTVGSDQYTVTSPIFDMSNDTAFPAGSYSVGVMSLGWAGNVIDSNTSIKALTKTAEAAEPEPLTAPSNVVLNRDPNENNKLVLSWDTAGGAEGITYRVT